ncbi:O-antigen ligase family protein [Candidatus Saganbacteria bacterium]|nr:O-antigen ligase family protein [Candidatus Saganbacteria bacterium]
MKIKYFDKAIEWMFLGLMILLPIIFDRRIGIVFSGTKSAMLRLFILLIATIWIIKILIRGNHVFSRTRLDWPILTYLLCVTAATVTSINVIISFFGFYGRYEGLTTWYCYAMMFFIATNYFHGFAKLKQLIAIVAPTATAMAVYGIIQRMGNDPYVWGGVVTWQRVIATIGQPNFLSAYMDMAFFILFFFLLVPQAQSERPIILTKKKKIFDDLKRREGSAWLDNILLPIIYYLAVPLIFIIMIYTQDGQNPLIWYFFFIPTAICGIMFAQTFEKLPDMAMKALIGISIVLVYICNFYTQSRGGYIGLGVGLVLILALAPRKRLVDNWKLLSAVLIAISVISIATALNPDFSPFARFAGEIKVKGVEEQSEIKTKEKETPVELGGAAGSRGETWKSALGIISDNPVFGVGPEVLKMVFPRYETDLFRFKEAFHVKQDRSHNETFDVPVTKGLISFFVYLFILLSLYRFGLLKLKSVDDDRKVLIVVVFASLASYIIQNQFSFGVIAITSLFWVFWAVIMNISSNQAHENEKIVQFDDIPWIPAGIIVVIAAYLCLISVQQFKADKEFKMGKTLLDMRRFSEAVPYFNRAIDIFPYEGGTVTHYGIALLNNALSSPASQEDQQKKLQEALDAFAYGMRVDPLNADNYYISSRIHLMQNNIEKTLINTAIALKIDPYYAEAYLTYAAIAEKQGKFDDAKKAYAEAYRINPTLSEPKLKLAFSHLKSNELDPAFKLFQEMLTTDPNNADVHKGLAEIYGKRGETARAREELDFVKSLIKK